MENIVFFLGDIERHAPDTRGSQIACGWAFQWDGSGIGPVSNGFGAGLKVGLESLQGAPLEVEQGGPLEV